MKESVLMHKSSRTIDAGKRKNHFSHANINVIPQQNRHLPINLFYMINNSRCTINMTGSRNADYQQANLFYQNPGNLIWHHIEGVRYNRGNYNCDMILTIPMYHAQQHIGAVKEYEILTGNHYNP